MELNDNFPKDTPVILPESTTEPSASVNNSASGKRQFLFAGIGVLVGFALAVGLYFILPKNSASESVSDGESSVEDLESLSDEEMLSRFDEQIATASSASDILSITLGKADFLITTGRENEAIAALSSLPESELTIFERYSLYGALLRAYESIGDTENYEHYTALYAEIYSQLYDQDGNPTYPDQFSGGNTDE